MSTDGWVPPWKRGEQAACAACGLEVMARTLEADRCVQCVSSARMPAARKLQAALFDPGPTG